MLILGLNDSNSAAAIIRDGCLVAAAREERFDRIKFSDAYPTRAVNYCLQTAGAALKEVDHVVFAWNPGHEIEPLFVQLREWHRLREQVAVVGDLNHW